MAKQKTKKKFFFLKWFFSLFLIFSFSLTLYSFHLAKEVRIKFEGKRWSLPARVYAKPLELYIGAPVSAQQFADELKRIGYKKVKHPKKAGEWSQSQSHFLVATRRFEFSDGIEIEHSLDIRFSQNKVSQLRDGNKTLDLMRLEPVLIDSIHADTHEDRVLIQFKKTPSLLIKGLLAVEDRRFYQHHGVSPLAIVRAIMTNIIKGKAVQGGSTLTQQLVKNFYLTPERSLKRKLNEALMSIILEIRYEKNDILEAYLNEIFLGQDGGRAIHGFGLAAKYYFNRPLQELEIHQYATLIGMVKGASWFNPRKHLERVKARRDTVLKVMLNQQVINNKSYQTALKQSLTIVKKSQIQLAKYPAFMQLVKRQLANEYKAKDLNTEGLKIFTTLDPWRQEIAQATVTNSLKRLEQQRQIKTNDLQGALISINPQTGNILALVGERHRNRIGFNRALDAIRPIGSLVKPFIYLSALEKPEKYHIFSLLDDSPLSVELSKGRYWEPLNYNKKNQGQVTLISALSKSLNIPTVRLGLELGLKTIQQQIIKFNIKRPFELYPSMLLGALSLSPLEVAQLYQGLANEGFSTPLKSIIQVTDSQNHELQRYPLIVQQAASTEAVYLVNRILQTVVSSGTARRLNQTFSKSLKIAAKTGTTNDLKDSWFAAITGGQVDIVWIGNDQNKPTKLTGSSGALIVWRNYMQQGGIRALELFEPENIVTVDIETTSGLLNNPDCLLKGIQTPYIKGYEPVDMIACEIPENIDVKKQKKTFLWW